MIMKRGGRSRGRIADGRQRIENLLMKQSKLEAAVLRVAAAEGGGNGVGVERGDIESRLEKALPEEKGSSWQGRRSPDARTLLLHRLPLSLSLCY